MASLAAGLAFPLGGDDEELIIPYKVRLMMTTLPPVYNTRPGTVLFAILNALGSSDDDIGGAEGTLWADDSSGAPLLTTNSNPTPIVAPVIGRNPTLSFVGDIPIKTQLMMSTVPPLFNTRPGTVMFAILNALGTSDNDIGGQ